MSAGLSPFRLQIRNYKCFGDEPQGFDQIRPINLIIGRNNSGKSALLDLVELGINHNREITDQGHNGNPPQLLFQTLLGEESLRRAFQEGTSGGPVDVDHWVYGRSWLGKKALWELSSDNKGTLIEIDPPLSTRDDQYFLSRLARGWSNPFGDRLCRRLSADRDLVPESDGANPSMDRNGRGVTNAYQRFISAADRPSWVVEEEVLRDLNKIFMPDTEFRRILVQQRPNNQWELYLDEVGKGRIPLSDTGSGLRTVLLVLSLIHLAPRIDNIPLDKYVFGLEELENNLHPALQRRLFAYLRDVAAEKECIFFVTSHSSIAIDLFSADENAQILHVLHDDGESVVRQVRTYIESKGILEDLDFRASDILQSNGVIWVEGPSDRIYVNRWIELASGGQLQEGSHYQCISYGGRLLAHLNAEEPGSGDEDAIEILRLNRNAAVVIDSDKKRSEGEINSTKRRIVAEIEKIEGFAWVTAGTEIENYIPIDALQKLYEKAVPQLNQYDDFPEYLDSIDKGKGEKFKRKKVLFAGQIVPHITRENFDKQLDLGKKIDALVQQIYTWNGMGTAVPTT